MKTNTSTLAVSDLNTEKATIFTAPRPSAPVKDNHSSAGDSDSILRAGRVAFIDAINLHKGVLQLGWRLDYRRFRTYLTEFHGVNRAYVFHGYLRENRNMYRDFRNWGYCPVFRPTCHGPRGNFKGNCDTELTLRAVIECCENKFDQAVLVSGDGDFVSVTSFLESRGKLRALVAPSFSGCSRLFAQSGISPIFLEPLKGALEFLPKSLLPKPGPKQPNPNCDASLRMGFDPRFGQTIQPE